MGENRVCKCPVCGLEKAYRVGIGFMSDIQARMERGNILDGFYGPKAKAALVAYPEAAVGVEWALYQCRDCARLESRLAVKISGPVRVPILQRCDCGSTMRRIRTGKEMLCPDCRKPLKPTDIVAVTLWD